jgi:hypothetical protein
MLKITIQINEIGDRIRTRRWLENKEEASLWEMLVAAIIASNLDGLQEEIEAAGKNGE